MFRNIVKIFSFFTLLFLGMTMVNASLSDGLVAYYPFDGDVNDYSGNGNDATNYGATLVSDRDGNIDSAYSFDGNDYMELNNDNFLFGDNPVGWSLSIWYSKNISQYGTLISSYDSSSYDMFYGFNIITLQDNRIMVDLRYDGNTISFNSNKTLILNEKYNILVSFDKINNVVKLYINGILDNTIYLPSANFFDGGDVRIGCSRWNGNFPHATFIGIIEEITLWNRSLSEQEIQELYQGNEGNCPIQNGEVVQRNITFEPNTVCNLPDGFSVEGENIHFDCRNSSLFTPGSIFINATGDSTFLNCSFYSGTINVEPGYVKFTDIHFDGWEVNLKCAGFLYDYCGYINSSINTLKLITDGINLTGNTVTIKAPEIDTRVLEIILPKFTFNWDLGYEILNLPNSIQEVFLDCNDGIINGNNTPGSIGLYVNTTGVNVTIQNCIFQNYDTNVFLENFEGDYFINNTIRYAMSNNLLINNANNANFQNLKVLK